MYAYILANGGYKSHGKYTENGNEKNYIVGDTSHPGYTPTTELLSLWDLVCAVYAIRNAIAHEGQFDLDNATAGDVYQKLAARLRSRGHPDPLNFIKLQAQMVIWREV